MRPLNVWRSTQRYPTNGLCARGFARELQLAFLGAAGDAPHYPEVERAFRDATGADLGRATWHGWSHGQRLPMPRTGPSSTTPSTVLRRDGSIARSSTTGCRRTSAPSTSSGSQSTSPAWRGRKRGRFCGRCTGSGRRRAPEESRYRRCFSNPRRARRKKGKQLDPHPASFGRSKGTTLPLTQRSTDLGVSAHEPLNPSSILLFLMRYAFESGLPDPGLKQAFVLDFLTGSAAAACLVQIIAPERVDDWGLPGRIFMAMRPHFWSTASDEQVGLDALFVAYIEPLLKMTATMCPDEKAMELLPELKAAYYNSLGVTGLSERELQAFASANLCG